MRARRHTAQEQYQLIMECRSSGLTDYQWCVNHGIKPTTFYSWVDRLKSRYNFDIPKRGDRLDFLPTPKQDVVKVDILDEDSLGIQRRAADSDSSVPVTSEPAVEIHTSGLDIMISNHANPELVSHILRTIGGGVC